MKHVNASFNIATVCERLRSTLAPFLRNTMKRMGATGDALPSTGRTFPTCAICIKSCCILSSLLGISVAFRCPASGRACSAQGLNMRSDCNTTLALALPSPRFLTSNNLQHAVRCHPPEDVISPSYNMTLPNNF